MSISVVVEIEAWEPFYKTSKKMCQQATVFFDDSAHGLPCSSEGKWSRGLRKPGQTVSTRGH